MKISASAPPTPSSLLECWLGGALRPARMDRLSGGACSAVYHLQFDRPPHDAVAEIYPNATDSFVRQRDLTTFIATHASFPAPKVFHEDSTRSRLPFAFLLLERLEGLNLAQVATRGDRTRIDRQLADSLFGASTRIGGSSSATSSILWSGAKV